MANRFHTYFGQIITNSELNEIFDSLFAGIDRFVQDFGFSGIAAGADVTQHTPNNLTVDVGAPAVVYDQMANRMGFGSPAVVNCALDENGSSTSVIGGSNQKWLALFIEYTATPTDPRTDDLGATVYYRSVPGYRINVAQGAEAPIGTATRPPLRGAQILLADVLLGFGMTTIANASIYTNRTDVIYELAGSPTAVRAKSLSDVLQAMLDVVNTLSAAVSAEAAARASAVTALAKKDAVRSEFNSILNVRSTDSGSAQYMNAAAIGAGGRIVVVGLAGKIAYSNDAGRTWTAATGTGSGDFYDVIWIPTLGIFVAVSAISEIYTSATGTSWSLAATAGTSTLRAIAWNGTTICAIGGTKAVTSTNGVTWNTTAALGFTFSNVLAAASGGLFAAHEASSANVKTSPDGSTWLTRTLDQSPTLAAVGLEWSAGQGFVIAGAASGNREVQRSADGILWGRVRAPSAAGTIEQLIVGEAAAYVLAAQHVTNRSWLVKDGVSDAADDFVVGWINSFTSGKTHLLSFGGKSRITVGPNITNAQGYVGLSQVWSAI